MSNIDITNPINPKYGVPVPLFLKCTKSGKEVVWTNAKIIKAKIEKAGSLEAFLASYVSKGANGPSKTTQPRQWKGKAILDAGSDTTSTEESEEILGYNVRITSFKEGPHCTVIVPVYKNAIGTMHEVTHLAA